ncbi:polyprenol monophosphomannose synthase [Halomarina litorea]|uniref:polyprenol monophosphomannose synthase n=1 Tax=Halomarina litorea TaxID=2961595 RepID=UPI0020C308DA|nr:polyprenol monophosphomannose synthase [Halomarina sp. BCD28]
MSLVLPTYNEASNVVTAIDRCVAALTGYTFELIVVDDHSPDGTSRLVHSRYGTDDRIRLIDRRERGLAAAVVEGIRESTYDWCIVIDADLQHPPEYLPSLVAAFDADVDVVVGSRYVEGGAIEGWSLARRLVSRGATALARRALPQIRGVADPLSGFFAVRRARLDDVELAPIGYKVLLELLVACDPDRVREVPYVFHERERGESKLSPVEYVQFLRHLARLLRRARSAAADARGGEPTSNPTAPTGDGWGRHSR